MKNLKLILLITLSVNFLNAQMNFEHGTWKEVLEKAKKENKNIFVDVYTVWCGPCKLMSKSTFTNDTVANFYNANFINYKIDAEKGEGIEIAHKYEVNCYPNLLIINPNGEIVHRGAGYKNIIEFIAFGKTSQNANETFVNKKNNYLKEGLNEKNILNYVNLMDGTCQSPKKEVESYLKTVKDVDLLNYTNWVLVRNFINDYNSKEFKYVLANYNTFSQKFGADTLKEKIAQVSLSYFRPHFISKGFNETTYKADKIKFSELNWPNKEENLFHVDCEIYKRYNTNLYFDLVSKNYSKYFNNNADELNSIAWKIYEKANKPEHIKAGVDMAKRACQLEESYAYIDTYAAVLYKSENYKDAKVQAEKAIVLAKNAGLSDKDYEETKTLLAKINEKIK